MKESMKRSFQITSYDLNPRGEARLTSLAYFFQEIAYNHTGRLGFGYHDLMAEQTFWVLSRMKIRILRYPLWDEEILVETWPCDLDKLFAMRDFRIFSGSGQIIGMASTAWLILKGQTRRPVRPTAELAKYSEGQEQAYTEKLKKIDLPRGLNRLDLRRVVYSDLDVVGHVNNVKYMEWCIDAAGNKGLDRGIGTFEINFIHESLFGDEIEIRGKTAGEEEIFFLGRRTVDELEIFRAHLVWDQTPSGNSP